MRPITPAAITIRIVMLSMSKMRGVLSDLSLSLNSLTWLVIEMKVALLEAELKVSLSFYLLAANSPSDSWSILSFYYSDIFLYY